MDLVVGAFVTPSLQLVRPLAEGAMGNVWVARHLTLELQVAVKFVRSKVAYQDPTSLDRLRREALAATRIKSPHVVQIFDQGSTADGTAFIVMELLEGETLATRLSHVGPFSVSQVLAIAEQTAGVLDKAHALGIVHRDIKPENLFLTDLAGRVVVKVLDFGLAKLSVPQTPELTVTGAVLGTPAYMSPEQLRNSRDANESADLWALAVTLYKALTGRLPFEATTPLGIAVLVSKEAFAPVHHYRAGLPLGLEAWFARALAKDPRQRFATAFEFLRTFSDALGAGVARDLECDVLPRSCLDEEEVLSMVEGRLSDREMTSVEQHLDLCSACCEFVGAALEREPDEPQPGGVPRPAAGVLCEGALVARRYRVERWLQTYEVRHLYDATDLMLQERVALETLPVTLDDEPLRQLLRDVRLARRIRHPNVCSTHDVYLYEEQPGTCVHCITSEFVEGETLRELLHRVGSVPLDQGIGLFRQLLLGLREVHAVGLLHRDLRPEKIIIRAREIGRKQAVILHACYGALARSSAPMAAVYRAPEQIEGGKLGPETDVFACGIMAYELLTGHRPSAGRSPAAEASLPSALVEVLDTCLCREPERRYQDAEAALRGLAECHVD